MRQGPKILTVLAALTGAGLLLWAVVPWAPLLQWAAAEQRGFQTVMARALRAIQGGDSLAVLALCSATAAYGFVHALGPGHGKVLLGGAALASSATLRRMALLTLLSSLAQAAVAIALVGALALLLGWAAPDLVRLTEAWLAPASALAIAGIGALLMLRGLRAWRRLPAAPGQTHSGACGCGHAHGPELDMVQSLTSPREAAVLVLSIAMRPCTGALFVLVIALSMEIFAIGCLAVVTMGLGTAAFNLIVATSGVAARRLAGLPLDGRGMRQVSAGLHVLGGALITCLSLGLTLTYLAA